MMDSLVNWMNNNGLASIIYKSLISLVGGLPMLVQIKFVEESNFEILKDLYY